MFLRTPQGEGTGGIRTGNSRELDLPVAALCSYHVNHALHLPEELFLGVIQAHGLIVTSTYTQEIKFEEMFPTITNEVLEKIFGQIGKRTILRLLRNHYSLTPQKMGENPELFIQALNGLMGSGGQTVTKNIVAHMQSKMGIAQKPV